MSDESRAQGLGPHRLPLLLWGDVLAGRPSILRRALAGSDAHECMYAWVYMTDFIAHGNLLSLLESKRIDISSIDEIDGELWSLVDRNVVDPQNQIVS